MATDPQAELRRRAERRIGARAERRLNAGDYDLHRLLHELELHEAELEVQNEELRDAQTAAEDARDRYFHLYELAPVGYLTLNKRGRILESNLTAADILGVPRGLLLEQSLAAFAASDSVRLYEYLGTVFGSRAKQRCELTLHRPDGKALPVLLDSIASPSGEEVRCLSALVDLSEKQEAETALRAREAWLRTVLDTAVDAIVTLDARGVIESFNRAATAMFGWEQAEAVGRGVEALVPEYMEGGSRKGFIGDLMASRREPFWRPERLGRRRDSSTFPLEIAFGEMSVRGEKKCVAVITDISERVRKDAALRASAERFRQISERIEDVFYIRDAATGEIHYLSPAFERVWGCPAVAILGDASRFLETVHAEDREQVREAVSALVASGLPFDHEYRILRPDGTVRTVRDRAFVAEGDARAAGILQDVTEERQLEEDLRQAQKMEAVGALASGVAHDFNNLLMGILGCIRLARKPDVSPEQTDELLEEAAGAADRGAGLTRQLLTFSRRQSPRPEPLELDTLISGSRQILTTLLGEHIRLSLVTGAAGRQVRASVGEIEQILMNLAANARDAMPGGGELALTTEERELTEEEAEARSVSTDRVVALTVRDSGCGMEEETRTRIFEPFFTTKDVGEGTGLGLSTTFAVVRRLGGWISVQSTPGAGTTFTVCLPVLEEAEEAAGLRAAVAAEEAPRGSGTVLLVEDEPLVRLTVKRYLESLGYEALVAKSFEEGIEVAREGRRIQALLTDVFMPGGMGRELAKALREGRPDLQVLFISASGREELVRVGNIGPEDSLLEKPFEEHELGRALRDLLGEGEVKPPAPESGNATLLLVEDSNPSRMAMKDYLETLGYRVLPSAWPHEALELARREAIDLVITDSTLAEMEGDVLIQRLRVICPGLPAIVISGYPEWEVGTDERFLQKPIPVERLREEVEGALAEPEKA